MLDCTPSAFWQHALISVLPPVAALLSATALWVAARARSISAAEHSTLEEVEERSRMVLASLDRNGLLPDALDRRKSSMKGTTST